MLYKRILPFIIALFAIPSLINAQVTSSSISGTVQSAKSEPLEGATVTATHLPSGSVYQTIAKKGGAFTLSNLRIGGPYTLKVDYVGLRSETLTDITLSLGSPYNANITLSDDSKVLTSVVITGGGRRLTRDKTGAATNVNSRMITTLPSVSRSITDFTRLTPQANGNSFGGRDGRYNNVTIDGANLNNNFGIVGDPLPGGGSNPISLDAIEEISVNIAPYDVRQANFTGANISAVTKSGTNIFHGTAYAFYKDQTLQGYRIASVKLPTPPDSYNKIYGGSIGGPIIKNKLFFFFNGEYEERSATLNYYTPLGGSKQGNISQVPVDSLKKLSDYLISKYKYDPGAYDNFPSGVPVKNHKYLGKIDWNISKSMKFTAKYSDFLSTSTSLPSQSGNINNASGQGIITYGPKFSTTAMAFEGATYIVQDIVKSASVELTNNFHGKFSNQLLGTFSRINTVESHPGAQFPFVDIAGLTAGSKNNYLSFGNEPFNGNYNVRLNDVYSVIDNFSYYAGKQTFTAGVTYEYQKFGNGFMPGSQGYYAYGSLDDFLNNRAPKMFALTYSLIPGQDAVVSANLKAAQIGAYIQDEINVNDRLKVTIGIRADKPSYPEQPLANRAVDSISLYTHDGQLTHYHTGQWPKPTILWSPRVGFRWNVEQEKLILRGGTGIFTGRIPYVFLTNLPAGVGPYQFGALVTSNLQNFLFNPDPHAYNPFYNTTLSPAQFPTVGGTVVPSGAYALIKDNFKFPQVWRTDFGVDKQLGNGFTLTLEALYTKDINAVAMFNSNQKLADTIAIIGPTTRPRYSGTTTAQTTASRKLNATSGNAIVLENTNLGGAFSFTTQLSKAFSKGFYGSIAYTYTAAFDISANPGSQANSVWNINPTSNTQNDYELSYSSFAAPHRIVGNVSYRLEYFKHLATTISAYYEGATQGTYTYIYNGDVNNDGNTADLMYIPKDPSEIHFVNLPASGTTPAFTAQQQSDAFFNFIAQDPYLSKHQGQISDRNGARFPFYHRVDLKFTQDIFSKVGSHKPTLQFTVDIINGLNFMNRNWGIRKFTILNNNPLKFVNYTNGQPNFQLATYIPAGSTTGTLIDKTYINNNSISTTWSAQVGVRLIF